MDSELKSLLDILIGKIEGLQTTVTGLQATVEDLQGTVGGLQTDVQDIKTTQQDIKTTQKIILTRLDGMDKRFEDQSRVLAALIPNRIAAVPAAE